MRWTQWRICAIRATTIAYLRLDTRSHWCCLLFGMSKTQWMPILPPIQSKIVCLWCLSSSITWFSNAHSNTTNVRQRRVSFLAVTLRDAEMRVRDQEWIRDILRSYVFLRWSLAFNLLKCGGSAMCQASNIDWSVPSPLGYFWLACTWG